jgi:hypothetical protein
LIWPQRREERKEKRKEEFFFAFLFAPSMFQNTAAETPVPAF